MLVRLLVLLPLLLAGCGGPRPADQQCSGSWNPAAPKAGELARLKLSLRGGPELPDEARLLIGFPHPWYGLRSSQPGDGYPPSPIDPATVTASGRAEVGSWQAEAHEYLLVTRLDAGEVELEVPGIRMPNAPWSGFGPVVLLDPLGDGGYRRICQGATADVAPGPPERLNVVAPSSPRPGEPIALRLRLEDRFGNPTGALQGAPRVRWLPRAGGAERVVEARLWNPSAEGIAGVQVDTPEQGLWVTEVRLPDGRTGRSNPLRVTPGPARIVWGDIHAHSGLADGWGQPDAMLAYARLASTLDVAAVSEHDWQVDSDEARELRRATEGANEPGLFVTLPALEVNLAGHEVTYFFDGPRLERLAPRATGGATTLWEETDLGRPGARSDPAIPDLLGEYGEDDLLVVTHSSLAAGMGTALPPPEPLPSWQVIEIYSAHGNNECRDCPRSAWRGDDPEDPSGSVRDALDAGAVLGFIGAGDSHDGRPGNSRWGRFPGGLTAFVVDELTREGVHEAMRGRRTWATTGERVLLDFELGGQPMGSVVTPEQVGPVRFRVAPGEPMQGVDLICDGEPAWTGGAEPDAWVELPAPEVRSYCYLRVRLTAGGMAWSSPVYVRSE